jgi:Cys-Gly metallodipeptidase DUG1
VKVVRPLEDKNPVILGRIGRVEEGRKTVTFYGHYDVQPAGEADWQTNPWELSGVNEYLYGRGASDNKGPVLAFIFAVMELLESCRETARGMSESGTGAAGAGESGSGGGLPFNIVFCLEGEEESGSEGFKEAIEGNLHWFSGTSLIVIANTNWVGENVPCITYGMRGLLCASLSVSGPSKDVHRCVNGLLLMTRMTQLFLLRLHSYPLGSFAAAMMVAPSTSR